jgi:hypothetical protein
MRTRLAVLSALVLVVSVAIPLAVASAQAGPRTLAQSPGGGAGDKSAGGEKGKSGGKGQSDSAKPGAAGDAAEPPAEAGPPWTYQMARLSLLMLVLLGLGIFVAYRKLVMGRQSAGA